MYARDRVTLVDRRELLRVKVMSLAEEARIIRRLEGRTWGSIREEMSAHRRGVVREESRAAHVAYGLIRGLPIDRIEVKVKTEPDWVKVEKLCKRYGPVGFKVVRRAEVSADSVRGGAGLGPHHAASGAAVA